MDIGTLAGDLYLQAGIDAIPRNETAGSVWIKIAYGYYRDAENVEGMKKCREYLKDDFDSDIMDYSVKDAITRRKEFYRIIDNSELMKKILKDPLGLKLFKMELKRAIEESVEDLINYFESAEAR